MRIKTVLLLTLFFVSHLNVSAESIPQGNWNVIPQPQQVELTGEAPFVLNGSTTIRLAGSSDSNLKRCAKYLSQYIYEMTGIDVKTTRRRQKHQIQLALDPAITHAEGYQISASSQGIVLTGRTPAAVFHGVQTIHKALPLEAKANAVTLPAVKIADFPRFDYRAFHVDVGRHFFDYSFIKQVIEELSLHNINYFHWHLTEDQGWRLPVSGWPRLISVGSHRVGSQLEDGSVDTVEVSGYYTRKQVRDIVKFAADHFITIIPEIDMPGHMSAALAAYPELGCTGGPYKVQSKWGVFPDVLCAGNPKTMKFVKDVLEWVADNIPSPYIHLGGDECPKERWKVCPKCQAKIAELGLTDEPGHSKEDKLQAWFMNQAAETMRARGRKILCWNDVLSGKPAKDMTILAWSGREPVVESARRGYRTVVCPISNFYLSDPYALRHKGRDSYAWIYDYPVIPKELTPSEARNIVGVEGCIWTEWVPTEKELQRELLPRLNALAEVQWTLPEHKNLDSLIKRLPHMEEIYKAKGYYYRTDLFE